MDTRWMRTYVYKETRGHGEMLHTAVHKGQLFWAGPCFETGARGRRPRVGIRMRIGKEGQAALGDESESHSYALSMDGKPCWLAMAQNAGQRRRNYPSYLGRDGGWGSRSWSAAAAAVGWRRFDIDIGNPANQPAFASCRGLKTGGKTAWLGTLFVVVVVIVVVIRGGVYIVRTPCLIRRVLQRMYYAKVVQ